MTAPSFPSLLEQADLSQDGLADFVAKMSGRDVPRLRVWRWLHDKAPPDAFALAFLALWCRMPRAQQDRIIDEFFGRAPVVENPLIAPTSGIHCE